MTPQSKTLPDGNTEIHYVPSETYKRTVSAIQTVAPTVAGPWGEVVAGAMTVLSAGLAVYARTKSKHNKQLAEIISAHTNNNATKGKS